MDRARSSFSCRSGDELADGWESRSGVSTECGQIHINPWGRPQGGAFSLYRAVESVCGSAVALAALHLWGKSVGGNSGNESSLCGLHLYRIGDSSHSLSELVWRNRDSISGFSAFFLHGELLGFSAAHHLVDLS